ncbi:MAG: hypothetical protein PF574_00295 [Candidatus Delongbacteria bacterium]|nr:hypothetical protein [Candidatus Delongbacteria bacterium]
MKKLLMLVLMVSLTMVFAIPKPTKVVFKANTGDKELDFTLTQFNVEANLNVKSFNAEMTTNYKVTEKKLEMLRVKNKMQPSDIYMALEVSKVSGKAMEDVLSSYKKNNKKGWGVIAKKMGIKPGSKEFKALKKRIRKKEMIKKEKKLQKKEQKQIKNKQKKPKKNNMKSSKQSKGKEKK